MVFLLADCVAMLFQPTGEGNRVVSPDQSTTARTLLVILGGLAACLAILFAVLLATSIIRAMRRSSRLRVPPVPKSGSAGPDPWFEAGRRVTPATPSELRESDAGEPAPDEADDHPARASTRSARAIKPPRGGRPLALVTGAARRVGRAIAIELARRGCDVTFTYNTSRADAESLARELSALGATASFYEVDFAEPGSVEAFAAGMSETLPRLDVLVHNASVYEASPLGELGAEQALRHYRVNALAPLMLTARLAPLMERSVLAGGAAVVAMCDIHAMGRPRREHVAYSMSKAALEEMVRSLARDLAPNVRVNGVAPGVVAWPDSGHESEASEQARYLKRVPLGRAGEPEDAAKAVVWLALDATYVTGDVIRVDGGRWLG